MPHSESQSSSKSGVPCEYCLRTFANKRSLRIHQGLIHPDKIFQCKICGKTLANPSTFREHKSIHTGKLPYICIICGRAHRLTMYLKKHIRRIHKTHFGMSSWQNLYDIRKDNIIGRILDDFELLGDDENNETRDSVIVTPERHQDVEQQFISEKKDDTRKVLPDTSSSSPTTNQWENRRSRYFGFVSWDS